MKKTKEKLYLDLCFIRGTKASVIIGINTEEIEKWKQYLLKNKGQKKYDLLKTGYDGLLKKTKNAMKYAGDII